MKYTTYFIVSLHSHLTITLLTLLNYMSPRYEVEEDISEDYQPPVHTNDRGGKGREELKFASGSRGAGEGVEVVDARDGGGAGISRARTKPVLEITAATRIQARVRGWFTRAEAEDLRTLLECPGDEDTLSSHGSDAGRWLTCGHK